ncbi:hypothetical protein PK35_04730 [Tamlana nanhaiensis]|uniref:DNA-binding response regulator n=1 Tax=Neotamlana nanhaiensis TaxID=1382798 RepID=A0A0D7W895_9FLAO|nr:LytTR family DNA-binding domain-containing protein [Tamlana nanhaiensis]KJD34042.1 hypothetical protein PK35_04730 [Tamlana nanhaiensis]
MNKPYTVLIIDDEHLARLRLKKLVEKFTEAFTLVGEAKNGIEALKLIDDIKPDLIFLDIEMPGLTGFELLKKLNHIPLIIFCTAFEDYSLKAFESNSIDYLIKPVKEKRLEQTVLKLQQLKDNFSKENVLTALSNIALKKKDNTIASIAVKKGDKIVFVKLEDISHFKATEKYVTLFTNSGCELIEQSLTQLENKLPSHFLRVHRSYLINTHYVKDFQKYFNNRYIINLNNSKKTIITSGRSYKNNIKSFINP